MAEAKLSKEQLKECLAQAMSSQQIAIKFDINLRTVERKRAQLARQGWSPEHDMTKQVPDGFHLKGTSTLYGDDGQPSCNG